MPRSVRFPWGGLLVLFLTNAAAAGDFDGTRAFADLRDLVKLGPRLPESPASEQARSLIADRLRQAGWRPDLRPVGAQRPDGSALALVNLASHKARPDAKKIFLVTHFDTYGALVGTSSPGANEGGSGVAALLEIARQLPNGLPHHELWLLFCDGFEPLTPDHVEDGIRGSRELVRELETQGEMKRVSSVIYVDMIADADLTLTPGAPRDRRTGEVLADVAHGQGKDKLLDLDKQYFVPGDHRAFLERGVTSVLAFVDFEFGGHSAPGTLWHTAHDDLNAVSVSSLQQSGSLLLALVERLDAEH